MDLNECITRLETTAALIAGLARGVDEAQARWRPAPEAWSLLEVICHLADEEREDFRLRLDLTLHHQERELPPIDPQGWVAERAYNARDLPAALDDFLDERRHSLDWLRTLSSPDWSLPANHPQLAGIRAGDFMASWVAHDLLHLRQLVELHGAWIAYSSSPYGTGYAGEW